MLDSLATYKYRIRYALGKECWGLVWRSWSGAGWWVQHGSDRESRRLFSDSIWSPTSFEMEDWFREGHRQQPCGASDVD